MISSGLPRTKLSYPSQACSFGGRTNEGHAKSRPLPTDCFRVCASSGKKNGLRLIFPRFSGATVLPTFGRIRSVRFQLGFGDQKWYVVQTAIEDGPTLHPDDHRSRRFGAGSDLRLRHDSLCCRAVGPTLDHHRHLARGASRWHGRASWVRAIPGICSPTAPRGNRRRPRSRSARPPTRRPAATSDRASSMSACRTSP